MKILIADDDERILRLLYDYLSFNKYNVLTAKDGEEALTIFKRETIDLVLLDVMMPIYDGWIVCKEIRKTSDVPIIMLTAKDSDLDELFGFDIGADDYISKPFNITLLLARIKRLFKSNSKDNELNTLKYRGIEIFEDNHVVKIDNEIIDLNPKEFDLLVYFIKSANIVLSRDSLLKNIWGNDYFGDTRTVDTHINRLRNKLGLYSTCLKTVRGFGYKLGEE
ncbi:DNA-binding response regulator, OmpR family, contains REC and winged-helix (wHTH) domain [Clostridium collagenovorans DSM 3089]|uniref:Stage 0 sporulation protein A homolog n=1 Tax=Clostridium collagenovorans DSM 3089 TaxID=1121306 RepID=A0A1M5X6K9_9CLOT|nr:response regulator transcription factor [Clostridium collagenovorans]SHH95431.1 DNA-binding response regulator, OmpR family, contains REC and winged-helix (wHTH) domain [Clostridium collagenovorans DSM 3089]